MTNWARYQKELWGYEVIETEHGFVTYADLGEAVWVVDCWVDPDFRREGLAKSLVHQVETRARTAGKQRLLARIDVTQARPESSLQAQLAYGFVPFSADQGKIWLRRELV